jgi:hypothetical protein
VNSNADEHAGGSGVCWDTNRACSSTNDLSQCCRWMNPEISTGYFCNTRQKRCAGGGGGGGSAWWCYHHPFYCSSSSRRIGNHTSIPGSPKCHRLVKLHNDSPSLTTELLKWPTNSVRSLKAPEKPILNHFNLVNKPARKFTISCHFVVDLIVTENLLTSERRLQWK